MTLSFPHVSTVRWSGSRLTGQPGPPLRGRGEQVPRLPQLPGARAQWGEGVREELIPHPPTHSFTHSLIRSLARSSLGLSPSSGPGLVGAPLPGPLLRVILPLP